MWGLLTSWPGSQLARQFSGQYDLSTEKIIDPEKIIGYTIRSKLNIPWFFNKIQHNYLAILDFISSNENDQLLVLSQSCEVPIHPITPATLLDSICWTISEPTSSASIYMDSSWSDDANEQQSTTYFDVNGDARDPDQPTDNFSRPLKER